MDRISGANYILNGAGKRVFQDLNLAAGVAGTDVTALWLTGSQESIVQTIEAAGLVPSDADQAQLLEAIKALIGARTTSEFQAAGTFAFVVPAVGAPFGRMRVWGAGGNGGAGGGGGGGGGSAGGYAECWIPLFASETLTVVVGAANGGTAGGTTSVYRGGTGGIQLIHATGGNAGAVGPNGAGNTAFGTGAGPTSAIAGGGQSGQNGASSSALLFGGAGGSTVFGFIGGAAQVVAAGGNTAGNTGQPGAGGGGGVGTGAGGAGGAGYVVIEY